MKQPDVSKLIFDIDQADADGSQYQQRKVKNFNTRYCIWPGQTDDGRKHLAVDALHELGQDCHDVIEPTRTLHVPDEMLVGPIMAVLMILWEDSPRGKLRHLRRIRVCCGCVAIPYLACLVKVLSCQCARKARINKLVRVALGLRNGDEQNRLTNLSSNASGVTSATPKSCVSLTKVVCEERSTTHAISSTTASSACWPSGRTTF